MSCLLTVVSEQRGKEVLYCQVRVFLLGLLKERTQLWSPALLILYEGRRTWSHCLTVVCRCLLSQEEEIVGLKMHKGMI